MGKSVSLMHTTQKYSLEGFEPARFIELEGDMQCCNATIYDKNLKVLYQSEEGAIFTNFNEDEDNTVPKEYFPIFEALTLITL
jgi:hypothetical protein